MRLEKLLRRDTAAASNHPPGGQWAGRTPDSGLPGRPAADLQALEGLGEADFPLKGAMLFTLPPDFHKPLEKRTAPHSSIPAWRTPWTEEPGGL